MKIVVDGMGGDNAPKSNVEGVVQAIKEYGVDIIVTGDKDTLEKEYAKQLELYKKAVEKCLKLNVTDTLIINLKNSWQIKLRADAK